MIEKGLHFVKEKIPFALTGLIATGINFGVYLLLVNRYLPPGPATVIAYSSSVILNFFMQRYFVFELRRSVRSAFALSMLVSLGGLVLDWLIVIGLHSFPHLGNQEWVVKLAATGIIPHLDNREWVIKLVATGIVFFYNFYAKRRVFEGSKGEKNKGARPQVQGEGLMSDILDADMITRQRSPDNGQTTTDNGQPTTDNR